jgi:serine phosphatase RsbU (regulator of sigma subunit)
MKFFRELSLRPKLIVAFAGVVLLSGILSSIVYSLVLVATMKKSAKEKIEETAKVATHQVDQKARGLEIYADLIAADITFGQVLSFDSSMAISQKMEEFKKLSQAEVVAFVPQAERYVQIKDSIFVNQGEENLVPILKEFEWAKRMNQESDGTGRKGWARLGEDIYLLAIKPVLHFGANMGSIILAQRTSDTLAKEIASAAGADVMLISPTRIMGSSLAVGERGGEIFSAVSKQAFGFSGNKVVDALSMAKSTYFSLFAPIYDFDGKPISTLGIFVSHAVIKEAQNKTLRQVLLMAAVAAVLSAVIGFLLAQAIATPLHTMTGAILSIIEKGDLGIRIKGEYGAETGILTRSFNRLLQQLQEAHEKLAASERRMKQELTMASTVQEMLFPERLVRFDTLELASFIESSTETGGDWFGYAQDRSGQRVSVMIGDVTGHGMPAALITAITNGFFKGVHEVEDKVWQALAELHASGGTSEGASAVETVLANLRGKRRLTTADLLHVLNSLLLDSTHGSLLMTFFASVYDRESRELRYANAGHNRPFVCRVNGSANGLIGVTVLPSPPSNRLGESKDLTFVENIEKVNPGDFVLWYTDGLLECENSSGEMYGKRRLMNVLKKMAAASAEQVRDAVIQDARKFFGDQPRKDDITLVVAKIT